MEKKFIIDQKALHAVLASMQPICTKRTALDATSTILFHVGHRELVLKSTDLEISLQTSCLLVESTCTSSESFLVPGRRIFEIVKELDGTIEFTIARNQLSVRADTAHINLHIKNAQEFPPFPERIENLMHVSTPLLKSLLDAISFLIPQNNPNPALNGMLLEIDQTGITMTATDGHCLIQGRGTQHTIETARSWLLPKRAVFELKKIIDGSDNDAVFIGICANQLVFSGEMFNFFTKLLADPFPQYKQILDKNSFIPAVADKARFTKTLRRSGSLLSGQFLATRFMFGADSVRVSLQNNDVGNLDEELPIHGYTGDALDIRFYAPYLLNGVQAFPGERITFYLKSNNRPIIFESKDNMIEITYLVMPVSAQTNAT